MTLNLINAKKSLGIKFGGQQVMSEVLYLGNSRIEWVSSVKHLGNYKGVFKGGFRGFKPPPPPKFSDFFFEK